MPLPERIMSRTAQAEGSKIVVDNAFSALPVLIKYGVLTPTAARAIVVDVTTKKGNPDLTGAEKATLKGWYDKINTVTLPAGELEPDLIDAAASLLEWEWITAPEFLAIMDR